MRPLRSSASLRTLAVLAGLVAACGNDPIVDPVLEGRLETIVVEGPEGATQHFLIPDDGSDPLALDFDVDPALGSGARIGVSGHFHAGRFRVLASNVVRQSALAAVAPERTRTVAFVMVDYGAGVNQMRANVERFMFSTTQPGPTLGIGANDKSVLQFYDETSYGLFNVTGGIEGPLSWSGGAACNGSGGSQLANMLRGMLTMTYGHNIWYYGSRQASCEYGWGSLGNWNTPSSNVWFNGALFDGAITHEIGHNLGYQHASSIKCSGTPLANDPLTCTTTEYGSAISIMGNTSNGHMMALEKWYAGWFKGCNAVRVRSSATFNLLPIETACGGGVQALQIPMPVTTRQFDPQQTSTAPVRYYYLEYRNGTALDTGIPAAVYVVASDEIAAPNRTCARSVQMDMLPSSTRLDGMTAGQSFTDPAGGVTFSVTSLTPAGAVVNVMIDGAGAANTCMDGATLAGMGPTACGASTGSGGAGGGGAAGRGGTTGAAGGGGTTGAAGRGGTTGAAGGGAAGRGGTTGAAGAIGAGGRAGTTGAAGTSGSAGNVGRGGTTATGGQSGTMGAGGGAGTAGPIITGGTTGSTGLAGTTGGTAPGIGGGAGGPPTGGVDAGPPGPGQVSGGCACDLGAAPRGNDPVFALALALAGIGLGSRRPRQPRRFAPGAR